jgi:hypothetical protein
MLITDLFLCTFSFLAHIRYNIQFQVPSKKTSVLDISLIYLVVLGHVVLNLNVLVLYGFRKVNGVSHVTAASSGLILYNLSTSQNEI